MRKIKFDRSQVAVARKGVEILFWGCSALLLIMGAVLCIGSSIASASGVTGKMETLRTSHFLVCEP